MGGRVKSPSEVPAAVLSALGFVGRSLERAAIRQDLERRLLQVATVAVGVFLAWSAVEIRDMIALFYLNGDNASALVLAQFAGERGDGLLILGDYRWLEPLYAMHLTRGLPHHRQLWELAPFLVYGATVLLAGWSVLVAAGRRAAIAIVLAMAVPSPIILGFVAVPNAHGHTLAHTTLLAAFLVSIPRVATWGPWRRGGWAVALAATFAPAAASDVLVLVGAGLGFLTAVVAGWRLGLLSRGFALLASGACVAGIVLGHLLIRLAEASGIESTGRTFALAPADQIAPHVRMLLEAVGLYVHGRFGGNVDLLGVIKELLGLAMAAAVVIAAAKAARPIARGVLDRQRSPSARLLVIFWTVVALATSAAYVLSTAPVDLVTARYTLAIWPALVALVLLLAPTIGTRVVCGVAAVLAVMGCVALSQEDYTAQATPFPQGRDVGDLRTLVQRERLDHGYASYWDAATITAQTDFAVRAYPVESCGAKGDGRCPSRVHRIDRWYQPQGTRPVRTFYIVDSAPLPVPAGPPPARWGKPAKVVGLGQLQVFIYDYDLAGRLQEGT